MSGAIREKLKALIDRSMLLLETQGDYYTDGAKLALSDLVQCAVRALEGNDELPFIRNREFIEAREDEAVLFATQRYTMAPSYMNEGHNTRYYGLEAGLSWFEAQDVRNEDYWTLEQKAECVMTKASELISAANVGQGLGEYDPEAREKLVQAMERLASANSLDALSGTDDRLARAIVDVYNRLRTFRHSRLLRNELDPSSNLYVAKDEITRIKVNNERNEQLREQMAQIEQIANRYNLDYIEKASQLVMNEQMDYEQINTHFYVWSSTDKIANFTAPMQAVKATLSFVLPSEDNEKDGLGHVWIDNVEILAASGNNLNILNGGFDQGESLPDHWMPEIRKGNSEFKWESEYPFCGGGDRTNVSPIQLSSQSAFGYKDGVPRRSIYLCNPTNQDEGAWTYQPDFEIEGGATYTLTFAAKLDGKLNKGLKAILTYKDEANEVIDRFEYIFNRKSALPNFCFLLTMQCDAIQYALTEERDYAMKAKHAILYTLNDFCQGAEHWMVTNLRPQGSDSYGAVQGGRMLCSIAVTYSLIKETSVFSAEEKRRFYAMIEYLLRYMLDLRDRTELTAHEAQQGCSNWQTDMCAGTAYMMMALDDFPNRQAWLCNAHMVLVSQLNLTVNPDNSWPESIRYHHAALERFAGYAKVVRHMMGDNLFNDTPLGKMFDFSLQTQTPPYGYFGHRIGTPPFGDHALRDGAEFACFATYLEEIERIDRPLADRMYHTWNMAGRPVKGFWGEAIVLENLLGSGSSYEPESNTRFQLGSNSELRDAGIYIFRRNFGYERQSYFAIMSSPKPIGHGHLDQGSFILYKDSVPLVMDSGIEGYFDSTTNWHVSSYSHACVQFQTKQTYLATNKVREINLSAGTYSLERGWVDVPRTSRVLDCKLGEEVDEITIEIMNPEGRGRHTRHVRFFKKIEIYLIKDTIEDFEGEVLFSLPVASPASMIKGNRVYSTGLYDVDLETVFLSEVKQLRLEQGRSTLFFDSGHGSISMMDYIRAVADAQEGFVTLLYPKRRAQPNIIVTMKSERTALIAIEDQELVITW